MAFLYKAFRGYFETEKYKNGTSLLESATSGHKEIVEILLTAGANINFADDKKWTPLMCAAANGHKEIVEILLKAGADIDWKATSGCTPLMCAAFKGRTETVKILLKAGAHIDCPNDQELTPLMSAAANGHTEIVEILLKAGADFDKKTTSGYTPLLCAAAIGHPEIVEILLKAGADINFANGDKLTPLLCAAAKGHIEIVEMLIKAGTDINAVNDRKRTSLHQAAINGHKKLVEVLLKSGANINAVDDKICTPLHNAAQDGLNMIVEILLKAGADIDAIDYDGRTPLHKACNWDLTCLFLAELFFPCTSELGTRPNRLKEIVEMLLEAGANVNAEDKRKMTPLHFAAAGGNKMIAKILLDAGAICNAECIDGHTPLYYSNKNDNTEASEYLREHGATTGQGVWQRIIRNISSTFSSRTLSHTQTTKIVRRESTGAASSQTDPRETIVVSSESCDIQGGVSNDQASSKDQAHGDTSPENITPCILESAGNKSPVINDSQQSATSELSTGLSLQEGKSFRLRVVDYWAKFSLQHKGQQEQGQCSTNVTSAVKEGNITLNQQKININISRTNSHKNRRQGSTQITDVENAIEMQTLNLVRKDDDQSDNES